MASGLEFLVVVVAYYEKQVRENEGAENGVVVHEGGTLLHGSGRSLHS